MGSIVVSILCLICLGAGRLVYSRRIVVPVHEQDMLLWPERLPVTVIVPARNEACNLPGLLEALNASRPPPAEILVVDDASTDETAAIARQHGAQVLAAGELPQGWRGKAWACHQGALQAGQEVLCFMDADTRPAPQGLAVAWQVAHARKAAVSIAAHQLAVRAYENLSAFFVLAMTGGVGCFASLGSRVRKGLFGPFLLVDRQAYQTAGGHAAVKAEVLEHFFMADRFREHGINTLVLPGRGLLTIRMYPGGMDDLIRGWRKAFADGAGGTDSLLLGLTVMWFSGGLIAFFAALAAGTHLPAVTALGWYALYAASYALALRRSGSFAWWSWLLYPIPLVFFLLVFSGCIGGSSPAGWKGRQLGKE